MDLSSAQDRFPDSKRVCLRVAVIDDNGQSLIKSALLSSGLRSVSVASVGIVDLFPYFMARVCLSFVRTTVDHSR